MARGEKEETLKIEFPTEAEVRALRDRVYESASTDANWEQVKAAWQRPDSVAWLREHVVEPPNQKVK